jgi:hypothetical protein
MELWPTPEWVYPPTEEWIEFSTVAAMDPDVYRRWLVDLETYHQRAVDLLFLEDVGAEVDRFNSGEPRSRLREILGVMKNHWMIMTTNIMPAAWPSRWDSRIADRLFRNTVVVEMGHMVSFQSAKQK